MAVTTGSEPRQAVSKRKLTAIVDFAVGSHARAVAVLLLVSLLGFLPGFFSIPPMDRDEARFAQATRQMVESGDYIDIRFQDEVRYKKPVGIYWLQAAVVKTAEALGFVSRRAAVLAALMMASCVLLGVERLIAKTDAILLLTTVAAMGAMARAYLRQERERLDASS